MSRYTSASLGYLNQIENADLQIEVVMLDGTALIVVLEPNTIGQELFNSICESVDLVEKEYFGLVYGLSEDGTRHWLDLSKPVKKFVKPPFILSCEVKFYPRDPDLVQDVLTRNYIYHQVKKDLLNSRIEASFSTYALLGSYMVQHEYGDYDKNSFFYVNNLKFAPTNYPDVEKIKMKVDQLHSLHKGMSASDAQQLYLQNAKKHHLYGVHLRKVVNENGEYVKIGVCASGILVLKKNQQIDFKFSWPKVSKVCCQNYNFYIKIKSSSEREHGVHWFIFHSNSSAKKFFKNCKEHHIFFRCSMQSNENIFNSSDDINAILRRSQENLLEFSDYGSLNLNDKGMVNNNSKHNVFETQAMEDYHSPNASNHEDVFIQEKESPVFKLSYEEVSEIENNSLEKHSVVSNDTYLQEQFQYDDNTLSYISENDEELNETSQKGLNDETESTSMETLDLIRQLQDALNKEYLLSEENATQSNDFLNEQLYSSDNSEKGLQEQTVDEDFSTESNDLLNPVNSSNFDKESTSLSQQEVHEDDFENCNTELNDDFPPPPEFLDEEINKNDDLNYGSSETVYETAISSLESENTKEEWNTPTEELQINFPSTNTQVNDLENETNFDYDVDLDKAILDAVGFDIDKTVDEKFKRSYSFRIKLQTNEP